MHTPPTRCIRRDRPDSEWNTTKVTVILALGGSNGGLGNLGLNVPRLWINRSVESTGVKYLLQVFDSKENRRRTEVKKESEDWMRNKLGGVFKW